jgi:hypothetical protein
VVARDPTKLIQDPALLSPARLPVPRVDLAQVLPPRSSSQDSLPRVTFTNGSTIAPGLHFGRLDTTS